MPTAWPCQSKLPHLETSDKEGEISLHTATNAEITVIPMDCYSSYTRVKCVTAWALRFVNNCHPNKENNSNPHLTTAELQAAEMYWVSVIQRDHSTKEIKALKGTQSLHESSVLLSLHPILDSSGVLRVGGRESNSKASYLVQHLVILHGKHPVTKLIVQSEHLRLLHAGSSLLSYSISHRYYVIGNRKVV